MQQQGFRVSLLNHYQLLNKRFVIRHTFLNIADDSLLIDEIGYPAPAIFLFYVLFRICHERETDVFFTDKFFKRFHIVVADTDYLCIVFLKCFQITLEVGKFAGSDGAECSEIKSQDNMFTALVIGQGDFTLVGLGGKGWRFFADLKRQGRCRRKQ